MKKDIVVGCIDLYEFDSLRNWIYSLNESGFDGRKILICYRISDETKQQIKDQNKAKNRSEKNKKKRSKTKLNHDQPLKSRKHKQTRNQKTKLTATSIFGNKDIFC